MEFVDIGEFIPIATEWWDENDQGVEPSSITVTLTKPDGTTVVKTKPDMEAGVDLHEWVFHYLVDQDGAWSVHAVGVRNNDPVVQDSMFLVGDGSDQGGPCDVWCTWDEVERCGTVDGEVNEGTKNQILEQASEILWDLSGRYYPGICHTTRSLCFACRGCLPRACTCEPSASVDLTGRFPIWGAWDVVVDGVTLDRAAYTVRGHRWLTRVDGDAWPSGVDVADRDAFRVTWAYGRNVPTGGRRAAATFAFELARLCVGDKGCQLPARVTNIQREGVTYTILDSLKMIEEGRTGLPSVDMWITADKIGRKPKPGSFSPLVTGPRLVS